MPTLEEIYRKYLDMVFRICSRYCPDTQEAEDLTQETFLRLDRKLSSFRGDSELGTWIYRVTTNVCLDYLRSRKNRNRLTVDYFDSLVVRNLDSGGDRVLAKIELDRILSQFRPSVRQMLFLTLAEGLSYREAAEVMGLSRDAVAKAVKRFLEKFSARGSKVRAVAETSVADCP